MTGTAHRPPSLPDGCVYVRQLGAGGMATVHLVRDLRLDHERALKVIHPGLAADGEFVRRFEREQQLAAQMCSHPNIVTVHHTGTLPDGMPYALLEYHRLGSLAQHQPRPPASLGALAQLFDVLASVAAALHHLARAGLVHRDVKPGNVLISDARGRVGGVLADFGLARAADGSAHTRPFRTPAYAAPEQYGGELTPAVDVYAFGTLVCRCLSGRFPFLAESDTEWCRAHLDEEPWIPRPMDSRDPSAEVRRLTSISDLIERSLRKDPRQRPEPREWETALLVAATVVRRSRRR